MDHLWRKVLCRRGRSNMQTVTTKTKLKAFVAFSVALMFGLLYVRTILSPNNRSADAVFTPEDLCWNNQPPICPVCHGKTESECEERQNFESCANPTDVCATAVTWHTRGVQIVVVKSCKPSNDCETIIDTNCLEPVNYRYQCLTCHKRNQFCPYHDYFIKLAEKFNVMAVCLVIFLVGLFSAVTLRCVRRRRPPAKHSQTL